MMTFSSKTSSDRTFRQWIQEYACRLLKHKPGTFLVWCDPEGVWKELLQIASEGDHYSFFADETHELSLRHVFGRLSPRPQVVWLPVGRDDITYFLVYAIQAEQIVQITLPEALIQFGVNIQLDQLPDIESALPVQAREWIDYPLSEWNKQGGDAVIPDDTILRVLASCEHQLAKLIESRQLSILNRRITDDFGLPELFDAKKPIQIDDVNLDAWRVRSLAALFVTEADEMVPNHPPGDRDRVIQAKAARNRALKLLKDWQKNFDYVEGFESLASRADNQTTLLYWAKNLPFTPPPFSSPTVENSRFQIETETLAKQESFKELCRYLAESVENYRLHTDGFWGKRARQPMGWAHLVQVSEIAELLNEQSGVELTWKTAEQAVEWYSKLGWKLDWAGELLFREDHTLPGVLVGVRAQLRQAYLRHLDHINSAFSELLLSGNSLSTLPFAGDLLSGSLQPNSKQPVAVLMVDACRFDVAHRLVEAINQGEPEERASVKTARAPLPSITPLGMTFALPIETQQISSNIVEAISQKWLVTCEGFEGNFAVLSTRKEWLKSRFKLKDEAFLSLDQILNTNQPESISVKALGRLVFVFDGDLDDHDCVLKPYGLDAVIDRYSMVIRRLRTAGYSTIFIVTDHGFYYWDPSKDEKEVGKPTGDVMWSSRRAIVGSNLSHETALKFSISGGDLECCIPRSINTFKTQGGLGFFHGGATLQELIIPFVTVRWPQKAQKIGVVLKPIDQITSLAQRIQIAPESTQADLFRGSVASNLLSRLIRVRVIDKQTGKAIFKSKTVVTLEPGGEVQAVELVTVPGAEAALKTKLDLQVIDADDEEILDRTEVILQVELDEWI